MEKGLLLGILIFLLVGCNENTPENQKDETSNTPISKVVLDKEVMNSLNIIFCNQRNVTLEGNNISLSDEKPVYIIQNNSELEAICPEYIEVPTIDFSQYYIIYSSIEVPSGSDYIMKEELAFNKNLNTYYFFVDIQKSKAGWCDIAYLHPYGVYPLPQKDIKNIELIVNYK